MCTLLVAVFLIKELIKFPKLYNQSLIYQYHPWLCDRGTSVAPQYLKFSLHIYSFYSPLACVQIKLITNNRSNKYKQTGKGCRVFSLFELWIDEWKQQQNIYRVMKTEEGKTLSKRHAWNVWEAWFHGHPSFFFYILFVFPLHSFPISLSPIPLSLSVAHQCGCSSVMTPTVAGPL